VSKVNFGATRARIRFVELDRRVPVGKGLYEKGAIPMANELQGKKIAFLMSNEGVEQVELTEPRKAVEEAGAEVDVIATEKDEIQAVNHLDKGDTFQADKSTSEAKADDYDGVVLPGGVANPDNLRTDKDAVRFLREFFAAGKPVGAICHAPWMLIEADVVDGRKVTSYPSLETDIRNAGGNWVDEECVVDSGLVTSRNPDDIPAFNSKIVEEFAEGVHEEQREKAQSAS
jgi:protease I